jgi:alpha-D-ribose 1-methylphosphonate 5-triphosphate diphosphatase
VTIAEFPTTREAASAGQNTGIANIMGSPNLVRGGSHSGNVAAAELAENSLLDILSSDYVPASLLQGAVMLSQTWGDMARAIATVTATPARHVGLTDRGEISVGKRADLLRFGVLDGTPLIKSVWSVGGQVA